MKIKRPDNTLLIAAIAFGLTACGGGAGTSGAGGDNLVQPAPSGIDRLGISIGAITGFGSIFINGVRFETAAANFDIDDNAQSASQSDLSVGDVVAITFETSNPTVALTVVGDEAVEGPVNAIDVAAGSLLVAGQTVLTTVDTAFDDSTGLQSLADIAVGDFVEVSGFFAVDGEIQASRIERKPIGGETEVHGIVAGKSTDTFMINSLLIDYTRVPALIDDDFPNSTFDNGDFVEVKGTSYSGETLLATSVEPDAAGTGQSVVDADGFESAQIEGLITRFVSGSDFSVAGVAVVTTGATLFEGGTAADLALNIKVEVEGRFGNGVLIADKVEIRRGNDLRVTALVEAIDPAAAMLTLLGITVRADAATRLEDDSDADIEAFSLNDIGVGDFVEVRGGVDSGSADILARSIEREDAPDSQDENAEIRAFVDAIQRPFITLAGVTVDTSGAEFRTITDVAISSDEFFASVRVGDLIEAEGFQTGTATVAAREVEFED